MRKKLFLLILGLSSIAPGISFRKVAIFYCDAYERGYGFDTDHDGKENLILSGVYNTIRVNFWEHIGYDRYLLEDTATFSQVFGLGYLDNDSLVDMVGLRNGTGQLPTYVYEAPDYYHNPTQIVWGDSGLPRQSVSVNIANLDGDTLKELLISFWRNRYHTAIYETRGDNQYALVWEDTIHYANFFPGAILIFMEKPNLSVNIQKGMYMCGSVRVTMITNLFLWIPYLIGLIMIYLRGMIWIVTVGRNSFFHA
jgi:hypothetical protein